ncbi:F-box/LRR-repeat protein 2-like [Pempheris klunzingeri]|uniref:F-box/LRR-repeat protein 2-like n=1 Tax=Pempheris klunzingeri TaxID=3127111 RepID=UPI003980F057
MDKSKKHELQMSFQAAIPTVTTHPVKREERTVSDLLEDSGGNCRQVTNRELSLHLLSDSLFSEQQKLRHVLDWAHSFLNSGSETHHEFCRADSLILADEEQEKFSAHKHSSSDKYHHLISCTAGRNEPAGVPVCDCWLCLPDEVWLSILALLPLRDLCKALQVCSRLHRLATDHTLWRNLRIENSILTERWLLCVGRRRPRSLCLYSCCGASLTSCGLEMFFTLCRNVLEELKVTSCIGPGLHGDEMLRLIGQLCRRVTSVDVSWSGATDTGVKALSDCSAGLRLKSVVLNGCHVTDDPLMKLVMKHKESLCRLEVFGCQFLTPSCLQSVYEMCPALQHLNIGQVPKINVHSLTVMTSQLKCLISLNITGLQAVTDATVDTLLQNCVNLQSLSLSSCPGVTDLTLHSIGKYTPCIRSLDVSGCKAVTDAGVQSLALGCRRLQQLDLSSTGTRNRGVTLLANYCSRHLNTVKLSFCHITLENILKLCRSCKRLKVLHLYGCAHLPTEREIREVNTAVKVYPLP